MGHVVAQVFRLCHARGHGFCRYSGFATCSRVLDGVGRLAHNKERFDLLNQGDEGCYVKRRGQASINSLC